MRALPLNSIRFLTSTWWNELITGFNLFCLYCLAAQTGLSIATLNHQVSPIWPATGIAIGILTFFGPRFLPAISLGAFIINFLVSYDFINSLMIMIGNSLEAYLGFLIIFKINNIKNLQLEKANLKFIGVILASLIAPIISASIGTLSVVGFQKINTMMAYDIFLTWWTGDLIGGLVFIPAFIKLIKTPLKQYYTKQIVHFLCLTIVTYLFVRQLFMNQTVAGLLFISNILIYYSVFFFNRIYKKIYIFFFLSFLYISQ